ncbi:unnamed protein product [Fraxinus pennsylvanica]|uniref:Pentatricopeptide repeat-containing protein n=1 Tax=Fraxinus pennsylvanica TaxID=56036 RepID=A0AAD1ZW21_9LAMI|nr:unnamed protein product [Fraxinus pennsylvanica]
MPFLRPKLLASLVESAVSTRSILLGRAAHAQIIKTLGLGLDAFLSNHLINMYSKLDRPILAQLVLSRTPAHVRSVVTWTSLISGHVQNGHFDAALYQFLKMRSDSIHPNDFTLPCLFKASAAICSPLLGQQFHSLALILGLINDEFVACSAFDMYSKTGNLTHASKLFDEMPYRNIATWNACISNAVLNGRPLEAIYMFIELLQGNQEAPNSITFCAFLNACSDGKLLVQGQQLHGYVIKGGYEADISVLNGLIDFYGKSREIIGEQVASSVAIYTSRWELFLPKAVLTETLRLMAYSKGLKGNLSCLKKHLLFVFALEMLAQEIFTSNVFKYSYMLFQLFSKLRSEEKEYNIRKEKGIVGSKVLIERNSRMFEEKVQLLAIYGRARFWLLYKLLQYGY